MLYSSCTIFSQLYETRIIPQIMYTILKYNIL